MIFGGCKFKTQSFNKKAVEVSSSMLLFSVIGLSIPAIFTHTIKSDLLTSKYESLSIAVALIMFVIYILGLYFSFFTHKDIYGSEHKGGS